MGILGLERTASTLSGTVWPENSPDNTAAMKQKEPVACHLSQRSQRGETSITGEL